MSDALEWREVGREPVADCRVFSVERTLAVSPVDGERHSFYRIQSNDWAQVVPITREGNVVLVRQYRHGAQRVTLEMPAGLIETGEDPAVAALRECLEETGYRGERAVPLCVLNPNPTLFANRLHAFVAPDVELVAEVQNTSHEHTEVVLVPRSELPRLLVSGEIDHALVVATLWRFLHDYGEA